MGYTNCPVCGDDLSKKPVQTDSDGVEYVSCCGSPIRTEKID